jgi:hypothetical protein
MTEQQQSSNADWSTPRLVKATDFNRTVEQGKRAGYLVSRLNFNPDTQYYHLEFKKPFASEIMRVPSGQQVKRQRWL